MIMSCPRCNKPMKDRLVADEFLGEGSQVTVTGIRAGLCNHCGYQSMDADMMDEIEMFVKPLLSGAIGMRLLASRQITIDLGHSLHPSAIDIAGPSFQHGALMRQRMLEQQFDVMHGARELAEEAA